MIPCPGCGGNGWHQGLVGSRICEAGCAGSGVVGDRTWYPGTLGTHYAGAPLKAPAAPQDGFSLPLGPRLTEDAARLLGLTAALDTIHGILGDKR